MGRKEGKNGNVGPSVTQSSSSDRPVRPSKSAPRSSLEAKRVGDMMTMVIAMQRNVQ